MARAYLRVDEALARCFIRSQEDASIRWVSAIISEEKVCLLTTGKVRGTVEQDFAELKLQFAASEPLFVLFATQSEQPRLWMLIAWVPDLAPPRQKMLYTSSREDLKAGLGSGYFGHRDYCANQESDLQWLHVFGGTAAAPLTEAEMLLAEEKKLDRDHAIKSSCMASVPFTLSAGLDARLQEAAGPSIIEVTLAGETLDGKPVAEPTEGSDPKYLLVSSGPFLIFYCPDEASLKLKMTYSTAKAALLQLLAEKGLTIVKSIEIRSNIRQAIDELKHPADDEKRDIAHQPFSKPSRPGRAGQKPRVKKWSQTAA